ncbi:hypothetical protein DPM19_08395 [Actinomadura craniellae]|uniref:DUF4230 domain-containing protein n=1 Tax=Actinomadura craniellae TaxID=2231787 RepID=A0A365H9U2_9ACTN|nr:DUF4230 domain-containing protein [Actinomadura craniellae]RAY15782.1 hypothetical protein DPM19_08395 [Actinomadura craniellae]
MTRPETSGTDDKRAERELTTDRVDRRRGLRNSLLLAVAVVAIVLGAQALNLVPGWMNPFGVETKDRSGPVVLKSIRDLARFEAASGNFQVIVDLEKDAKFLPDAVRGQRTLFVGNGSVDAYVDFSKLSSGAVTVNADRTVATIKLPRAQLEPANLDQKRSYVFATQRGLFNRLGDALSSNPADQQQLYVLAQQKITAAANESGLRQRADQNTKLMLENLLKSLGFTTVTVTVTNAQ